MSDEDKYLQQLLDAFEISDVKEYKRFLRYLYSLARSRLEEIIYEWTMRFYSEGNDPDWWKQQLSPVEYRNLQELMNRSQHYVMSGQFPQADSLFTLSQITRYEALEKQVALEMLKYSSQEVRAMSEVLPKAYLHQYQQSLFNIGKEIGAFRVDFNRFDNRELEILAAKEFPDGRKFRDVIFDQNQEYLPKRIRKVVEKKVEVLAKGVVTGASPLQMGKELNELTEMSLREAVTLMNDELAFLNSQASLVGYKETGIETYIYLATLETHTCGICRDLDHKEFAVKDAVPGLNYPTIHSHCRCTTKAKTIFADFASVRWNRENGQQGSFVSSDMDFNQWLKEVYYRRG